MYGQVRGPRRLRDVPWSIPAGILAPECRRSSGCGWAEFTTGFTPTSAAAHRLAVTVLTVDVPAVHLRVTDPEKTDGERAPGF